MSILFAIIGVSTAAYLWLNYTIIDLYRTTRKKESCTEWHEGDTGLVFARFIQDDSDAALWICTSPTPLLKSGMQHAQSSMPKALGGWSWSRNSSSYTTIIMKRSRFRALMRAAIDGTMDSRPHYA